MIVMLNGERRELPRGASVADAVALLSPGAPSQDGRGFAVAVGAEVIPRGQWASTPLGDGARIEVVAAIQGG